MSKPIPRISTPTVQVPFEEESLDLYLTEHDADGLYYDVYCAEPTHSRGMPGDAGFLCWLVCNDDEEDPRWAITVDADIEDYPFSNPEEALQAVPTTFLP